jgi:hypothetical protein
LSQIFFDLLQLGKSRRAVQSDPAFCLKEEQFRLLSERRAGQFKLLSERRAAQGEGCEQGYQDAKEWRCVVHTC